MNNISKINLKGTSYNIKDKLVRDSIGVAHSNASLGIAPLDASGKVPSENLPSYVDDVIEGYYSNGTFYSDSNNLNALAGETGKIYVDLTGNRTYRWSGSQYIVITDGVIGKDGASMLYKGTAVAHYSNFSSIPSGYSENDSYILDSSSSYSEIPLGGGDSLNGYSAPSIALYVSAPDHNWNVTKATTGDIYRVGDNLWQAQENNWVNMGSFRGSDGLTTSISVNGNTYTQSNGTIQLPNYPTEFSGDYNDLSNKPTIPSPTAVKGNAESEFRTGNVNITPANIGLGNVGNFKAVSTIDQNLDDTEKATVKANIGLENVGNFKAVSTVANQGLTDTEKTNARTNIGAGTSSFSGDYDDLNNKPVIPALIGDDAARANWSGDWRMPTTAELQALGNAVNAVWTTNYNGSGINGLLCTDKTDSSKVLFFPAAGHCGKGIVHYAGNNGACWSSSLFANSKNVAYSLFFSSSTNWRVITDQRYYGFTVRPILDGTNTNGRDYVEIGGIKWATMNIGANNVTDYGLYFQWGDTQGHTASEVGSGEGQKYFGWADYKYGNGTISPGDTGMTKYNATDGLTTLELSTPVEYLHKVAVTGDYNDLSNKPTIPTVPTDISAFTNDVGYLTQHQDISGKQDVIDSMHKLSANLVNDRNTTNKFTSEAEKATWNGKYSKPDTGIPTSDLEDDLQGHVYVDLGLPSGTLWATRNVGAVDELDAGDYYMQGKGAKKYDAQDNGYRGNEETMPFRIDTARQVWGDEWRMSTAAEFNELLQYTNCTFTSDFNNTHIRGLVCEKYGDSNTYIFLPAGGIYDIGNNQLIGNACYLSATRNQGSPVILNADYGNLQIENGYDTIGYNVRPVRSKLATGSGNSDVPTLNTAPTSSTVTYPKDGQILPFEIGQFCRVPKTGGGYDFYQLYDLVTEGNATTATWKEVGELPSNVAYISSDSGVGIVPEDGIRAETVTSAATMTVNPDVVTVINGAVGTAAITLQVPNDNLAHVWDILLTTDSSVAITFAMSNSATILYPNGFSVGASKAVEISVIGVGTKYYLRYGEFA